MYARVYDPDFIELDIERIHVNADGTFRYGFNTDAGVFEGGLSNPMTKSGTYTVTFEYFGDSGQESGEVTFEYTDEEAPPAPATGTTANNTTANNPQTQAIMNINQTATSGLERMSALATAMDPHVQQSNGSVPLGVLTPYLNALTKDLQNIQQNATTLMPIGNSGEQQEAEGDATADDVSLTRPTATPRIEYVQLESPSAVSNLTAAATTTQETRDIITQVQNECIAEDLSPIGCVWPIYESPTTVVFEGDKIVAKAWVDPHFKAMLQVSPKEAIYGWEPSVIYAKDKEIIDPNGLEILENTEKLRNVVVCTLCSCYPREFLGEPPLWYISREYKQRIINEPRKYLADYGLKLKDDVEIRVYDTTADIHYMVLPMRPKGSEGLTEEELSMLVTRDSLMGVGDPLPPEKLPALKQAIMGKGHLLSYP